MSGERTFATRAAAPAPARASSSSSARSVAPAPSGPIADAAVADRTPIARDFSGVRALAGGAPSDATSARLVRQAAAAHLIVQRKCAACEDDEPTRAPVQRKEATPGPAAHEPSPPEVQAALGSGQALDAVTRSRMESALGARFGDVRVHHDTRAAAVARSLAARAFTVGRDVAFASGEYRPGTVRGDLLLSHELAHVVQQRTGAARRDDKGEATDAQLERAADGAAIAAASALWGGAQAAAHAPVALGTSPVRVQKQVAPDYVVDEAKVGKTPPGAPIRIFFPRNSPTIPASELPKLDAFKSGPDRAVRLTLLGLATEDELTAFPNLARDRARAVDAELARPRPRPVPFNTAHAAPRTVTPGTLANTRDRPDLRFNRSVEILRPGEPSMSPSTPIAAPTTCSAAIETLFQGAKTMATDWIDHTIPELRARPITGPIAADLDQFFGGHDGATTRRVEHNLGLIRGEMASIARPANHDCADPNLPGCVSAIAFNSGGRMTVCSGYATFSAEDRARNFAHEAAHSTASLRVTGPRNAQGTHDFAYRHERMVNRLGTVNRDQALANSDSYTMFLMTRRAPAAITPAMRPASDPAPTGFARASDADNAQRALATAQVWIRLATQGLTDLHGALRGIGTGNALPATLGDPTRLDPLFSAVRARFPPILSTRTLRTDDLLMIAGVLDRYDEMRRLMGEPIALARGPTTAFARGAPVPPATTGSLTLTVDAGFLGANHEARARTVVDKLIELIPPARIRLAMRTNYGAFAELIRNLFQ